MKTFAAKTFAAKTFRCRTLAGPARGQVYRVAEGQAACAGADVGKCFCTGAIIGQDYHTGTTAGLCHGCS
jgi:hypothetical protein